VEGLVERKDICGVERSGYMMAEQMVDVLVLRAVEL
jgi:hypothetical protein